MNNNRPDSIFGAVVFYENIHMTGCKFLHVQVWLEEFFLKESLNQTYDRYYQPFKLEALYPIVIPPFSKTKIR